MAHQYKTLPQRDSKATMEALHAFLQLSDMKQAQEIAAVQLNPMQREALYSIANQVQNSAREITPNQLKYLDSLLQQVEAGPEEGSGNERKAYVEQLPVPKLHELLKRGQGIVWFAMQQQYVRCKYTGTEYTQYPHSWHVNCVNSSAPLDAGKPVAHDGVYLGRITPEGTFKPTKTASTRVVNSLMEAIEEAPLAAAVAYAQAIGHCAFCNRELTDEPSVAAGYGPICADKYGLPWGEGKVEVTLAPAQSVDLEY